MDREGVDIMYQLTKASAMAFASENRKKILLLLSQQLASFFFCMLNFHILFDIIT